MTVVYCSILTVVKLFSNGTTTVHKYSYLRETELTTKTHPKIKHKQYDSIIVETRINV